MLQAAISVRGGEWIPAVLQSPPSLQAGLELLDQDVPVLPEVKIDAVCRDAKSRPVLVLIRGEATAEEFLGRLLVSLAAFQSQRGLLERLYSPGIDFEQPPKVFACADRFEDRLSQALDMLDSVDVQRIGGGPTCVTTGIGASSRNGDVIGSPPTPRSDGAVLGARAFGASPGLLDEAKKRILRVSDDVEEQIDGDMVRFLLRDRVLAVLTTAGEGEFALYVGDQPDRRRSIRSESDLADALDDIFRRYLFLLRAVPD